MNQASGCIFKGPLKVDGLLKKGTAQQKIVYY